MATKQEILNLAKRGAKTKEEKKLVEKEQFKLDGKYTFNYVKNLPEFETRLWMLNTSETSHDKIKTRYSTRIVTWKNSIFTSKPSADFYLNLLQNTAAEIWFNETFNTEIVKQNFKVKCLSHFKLNRMEYKWIIVGHKSDLNNSIDVNKKGVPFIKEDLIFITYLNNEFVFWGAMYKNDYNATSCYDSFNDSDDIMAPTELFYDQVVAENPVLKDLKPASLKTVKKKKTKYPTGHSNIAKEKKKERVK